MNIFLCMGCWGREVNGIKICSGIENEILDLTRNTKQMIDVKNYLDKVYHLFDRPLYKNVHTALWNVQNKFSEIKNPVFNEDVFKAIDEFCGCHKKCGLYLRLKMK